ncbi:MAG: hypothetical protein ACRD2E_09860 [Terriglobales bacterium]
MGAADLPAVPRGVWAAGLLLATLLLGVSAAGAQNPGPTVTDPTALAQSVNVGGPLQLAGAQPSGDFFSLGLDANSGYETNVTGLASGGADWLETLSASLEAGQSRGALRWALSYDPGYTVYRTFSAYDRIDQSGRMELSWELSPRWFLRLQDSGAYGRYLAAPQGAQVSGSVLALNNFVVTPFARQFSQQPSVELDYIANYRWMLRLTAGYLEDRFFGQAPGTGPALSDLQGVVGSAGLDYRLSARTTLGAELDYDDSRLAEGASRMQVGTALLQLTRVLGPTAQLTLFAGPQESQLRENLGTFLPAALLASNPGLASLHQSVLGWSAGGTLSLEDYHTAWQLTLSRRTTDGGGLFAGAVEADQVTAGFDRRLGAAWTLSAQGGYERISPLGVHLAGGAAAALSSGIAGAHLHRQLGRHWALDADYSYADEQSQGAVPFASTLGRQTVSLGIGYRLGVGPGQ